MDIFDWISRELAPRPMTTEALLYDHMDSQSGRSLPVIYQAFDPADRGHWRDRGAALDFVLSTQGEGGRVLDFGPGDGWPSLVIAPFVGEVVGVEGSHRRVDVCRENAARLGMANATFVYNEPGTPLPFDDGSFDAVVAASSVEQSPDPQATLVEFHRVLRLGGRVRLRYEALGRYRGGKEREAWLWAVDAATTRLVLYDRHIDEESAVQVGLTFALPKRRSQKRSAPLTGSWTSTRFTVERLDALRDAITDAGTCATRHPSGATWLRWLAEIGFARPAPPTTA